MTRIVDPTTGEILDSTEQAIVTANADPAAPLATSDDIARELHQLTELTAQAAILRLDMVNVIEQLSPEARQTLLDYAQRVQATQAEIERAKDRVKASALALGESVKIDNGWTVEYSVARRSVSVKDVERFAQTHPEAVALIKSGQPSARIVWARSGPVNDTPIVIATPSPAAQIATALVAE